MLKLNVGCGTGLRFDYFASNHQIQAAENQILVVR